MDLPIAHDQEELNYMKRLGTLYQEVLAGCPTVFVSDYCYSVATYRRSPFLKYSRLWRATIKFEYKNVTDAGRPVFLGWHNREFHTVSSEEHGWLCVSVPVWWRAFKPCRALEVSTSSMYLYLGGEFVDGRESSEATISVSLNHVAVADHFFKMSLSFLTLMCPPRELQIQDLPDHDARIRVGSCGDVLFSSPQRVLEFAHGLKSQELVSRTRFEQMLNVLAIQRAEELN